MKLICKSFYFVRHGETDLNKAGVINGSIDVPLNAVGIDQAHDAARLLYAEHFDVIVTSPRRRAQETAQIIAEATGKDIIVDNGLVERIWGDAEGKTFDPTTSMSDDVNTPSGAELFSVFQGRVIKVISNILNENKVPLIVSHGGVFTALATYIGAAEVGSKNGLPFLFEAPLIAVNNWTIINLKHKNN